MAMNSSGNSLVVGTTADYIEWIDSHGDFDTIFLTSANEREKAAGRYRGPKREILADLSQFDECLLAVQRHMDSAQTPIVAIACFDDEALLLAAFLAEKLGLTFPAPAAIRQCLDKHAAKQVWRDHNVLCPKAVCVTADLEAIAVAGLSFPCVLKPHSGSGSECVFLCSTMEQAQQAAARIITTFRRNGAATTAVAEEYIDGDEFSCDFVVGKGVVRVLRTAGKFMDPDAPIGTTLAYVLPAGLPPAIRNELLPTMLGKATRSLGITHAICMADFMIKDDEIVLLEISPRIGGDCLPHVLFNAWGIDAITAAMSFSRGKLIHPWLEEEAPTVVGLRVFSPHAGRVVSVNTRHLNDDPRVIAHNLDGCRGRTVTMPPEDYSSRMLGHLVFQPYASGNTEAQIHELRNRIRIQFEEA